MADADSTPPKRDRIDDNKCWASRVGAAVAGAVAAGGVGIAVGNAVLDDYSGFYKLVPLAIFVVVGMIGGYYTGDALGCWGDGKRSDAQS